MTMNELKNMLENCKIMLDGVGIKYGNIQNLTINNRVKGRFGQCRKSGNIYSIEISSFAMIDNEKTFNTMMHELLHTVEGCMNHGSKWQNLASIVNKRYGLNITTRSEASEEQKEERLQSAKFILTCQNCKHENFYFRESKIIKNYSKYKCNCGGSLELKRL